MNNKVRNESLIDLLDVTIRSIISDDIQVKIDNAKQCILVWTATKDPIDFKIAKLKEHCHSGRAFLTYVQNKLRKAGIKC